MENKDIKIEFLYNVLNWLDDRRNAIDMRATVVLAIGSLAIGSLFAQWKVGEFLYTPQSNIMKYGYLADIIIFIIAILKSLSLIAPINRPSELKKKIQKNKEAFRTLTFFYDIAEHETKESYYELLKGKSENEIKIELSKQVVEISALLKIRYDRLQSACNFLSLGLYVLILYVIIKVFFYA